MNIRKIFVVLIVSGLTPFLAGCDMVSGIFKTGVGVGIIAALIIILLVVVIARAGRKRY